MKQMAISLAVFVFTLLLNGCLDVDVHTSVASNGASDRTIRIKNDKPDLTGFAFPTPDGAGWTISRAESTKDGKKEYTMLATKHFENPEALVGEYALRPDTTALRLTVNLRKSFGWFYTYFDYMETYHFNNPYGSTPVNSMMSPKEIEQFMHNDDVPELKTKYDQWELREEFESIFGFLLEGVAKRSDGSTIVSALRDHKEELFQRALHAGDKDSLKNPEKTGAKKDSSDKSEKEPDLGELMIREILQSTGLPAATNLKADIDGAIARNAERSRKWGSIGNGYTNGVDMPGLLLETNSEEVKGSSVAWKFSDKQIRVQDVVMHASSRAANLWAFVVTGLGVLLLIVLSAVSIVRRKS